MENVINTCMIRITRYVNVTSCRFVIERFVVIKVYNGADIFQTMCNGNVPTAVLLWTNKRYEITFNKIIIHAINYLYY